MRPAFAVGATSYDASAPSGLNRFTGEIVRSLLAEPADLTVYTASPELGAEAGDDGRLTGSPRLAGSSFAGNLTRLLWHQWGLPRLLREDRIDVFYSPLPEGMFFPTCPQVVTVHDLIPCHFPEASPRFKHYYRVVLPRILRASRAVIAISESTRRDMERQWDLGDLPIHVVYQGFRDELFRPPGEAEVERVRHTYGLGSYLLAVADGRPHKNLNGVLAAFAELRLPGVQLAVAGTGDPERILATAGSLGLGGQVRVLGPVPDQDLVALYGGALALVFPSHYEGFGIPPLEAMASGCPVVSSRASSLPEVCGEAAVYVDPASVEGIAGGIAQVANDAALRATLRERGLRQARRFAYASAAREILQVLASQHEEARRVDRASVRR